jgi:hypothetical protein
MATPSEPPFSDDLEGDIELAAMIAEVAQASRAEVADVDLRGVLAGVRERVAAADRSPLGWLRSRPTAMRRLLGALGALLLLAFTFVLGLRQDLDAYPTLRLAVAVVALGVLLGASLFQALRPLHQPPLAPLPRRLLVAASLLATAFLCLLPDPTPEGLADPHAVAHATPCTLFGLLIGLPVFLLVRLLDRNPASTAPLLVACAAGLLGNLSLQMHCANGDPVHLMAGHFSVLLLFLSGVAVIQALARRR